MNDSAPESPQSSAAPRRGAWLRNADPALWIAAVAVAFAAWQWHDSRSDIDALRQETAKTLAEAGAQARDSRLVAEQVREAMAVAQVKLGMLESRLAESQNQRIALEALYQELSRNRDEWAYAEIEQSLAFASQQLALAGNVKAALIALQAADTRLQRMDRPQLTALRKTVNCGRPMRCRRVSAVCNAISAAFTLPARASCWLAMNSDCSISE